MLQLSTFKVDCTPPVGFPLTFGSVCDSARDPLFLRGFVLDDGQTRCLVGSLDYCGLMNSAYDDLVKALAEAISVPPDHAVVHCIQQHDAPFLAFETEDYQARSGLTRDWWLGVVGKCAQSARECLPQRREVASVGCRETRLYGYASNRRVMGPDGRVRGVRWSRCQDEATRNAPAGTIDPMLRTVAFRDAKGAMLGTMSFYATHPQVSSGRTLYSADAPGEAMRLVGEREPNGLHAFFTGAGGNVTAGKYTSPTDLEGNLLAFGKRLGDAIALNLSAMRWEPAGQVQWRHTSFRFPRQRFDKRQLLAEIQDPKTSEGVKKRNAILLSALNYPGNSRYPIALLKLGSIRMIFVPGEPFVEYQLFIQSLIPDEFIALASNCGISFLYLPLARSFAEGGYEPTYCWCSRAFEKRFKDAASGVV